MIKGLLLKGLGVLVSILGAFGLYQKYRADRSARKARKADEYEEVINDIRSANKSRESVTDSSSDEYKRVPAKYRRE